MVFIWRHGGHVSVQNIAVKCLSGIWLYYYTKLVGPFFIVFYTNMAVSSRGMQTENYSARNVNLKASANARNIVGPNNVVSCCAMLADVCKRSQQVTTCWVFRWEYKGLWDVFHLRRHVDFLLACICVDTWHVVRVRRRNVVGCTVKRTQHCWTNLRWPRNNRNVGTCWLWSLTSFKLHPTTSNKSQQHATTHNMVCKRSQHVGPNNVASCWPTMLRAFARAFRPVLNIAFHMCRI